MTEFVTHPHTIESEHDREDHVYYVRAEGGQPVAKIEVNGCYADRQGIWGEVTVWYGFNERPTRPVIGAMRLNMTTTTQRRVTDLLADGERGMWAWEDIIEEVKYLTALAMRSPTERTRLDAVEEDPYPPFLIEPFVLDRGVSLLFGPGGTGKSMIALAMAVAVASGQTVFGRRPEQRGPVLYIDYEEPSARAHNHRLNALLAGMSMDMDDLEYSIEWMRPRTPIAKMRAELRQHMNELKPALIIVDSIGLARGGDAMGSEETIRLFGTLGELDTAVLGVDHVTKEDDRGGKQITPYGSIYTVNSVRLAWSVRRAEASSSDITYLNLKQTKRNHVAAHDPLGGEIRYNNEMVEFTHSVQPVLREVTVGLTDMWWQMETEATIDKAIDYLKSEGPSSTPEIARAIGGTTDSVGRVLRRWADKKVVKMPGSAGNVVIWGVLDE